MAEQQKKIIIIEDEPDTVEMYSEMMRLSGHKVLKLYEASSAFDLIVAEMPDAIVLDIMMPVVSGLDLLRELRAAPDLADIPVIVVSAKGLPQDIQAGFDAGASIYLTKPVTYQELSKAVQDILNGDINSNRLG
ncbi:MAG: response regulator [Anaerolineae bacterium]|nr:response regulator [Anaerolineae bacterium]MBL6965361.1 response regulator [Anaerolineales bacterium]